MTVGAAETDRSTRVLVNSALAGDEHAFRALVEPHRRPIHVHCYRMLGSLHEAEDVLQETLLRAWRRLDAYAGRGSFGAWLYGIATNACLDVLEKRRARTLPQAFAPPDDPTAAPAPPLFDVAWLEPYPDDPETHVAEREAVRLAFVAAIQHLPARQRAVLLLRDVLGWSAREVAALLDTSVASVNSALHRARGITAGLDGPFDSDADVLARRYLAAWEAADVAALAALLKEDVELAMPPTPSWYRGRSDVAAFLEATFERFPAIRLVPTRANGEPAFEVYDGAEPLAIKVLSCEGGAIASITGFTEPSLFTAFTAGSGSGTRPAL